MAVMEEAFCSYLLSKSTITALIGTGDSARLWCNQLPQGYDVSQGPGAVYEIIFGDDTHTLSDRSGFVESRMQMACYASTHKDAIGLARAIKNCGITTQKGVYAGVDFRGIAVEQGIRAYGNESPTDGTDSWRYLAEFEFKISYLDGDA
jgi:hypothetical protein